MPVVHEKNYRSRAEHAGKIYPCALCCADLSFNNSTDPEKQSDVQKQMQPIKMKKRIGSDAPDFPVQLAVVRKCAEFQQRGIVSNAVGRDLNSKASRYGENQDNRSAVLENGRAARTHRCCSMNLVGSSQPRVSSR